jgi:RNA polymerase sigma factor (sigma-70 family)
MMVNSSRRRTVGNSLEAQCYLAHLTDENLNNFRRNFQRSLKQFHLLGIYEPDEVIDEAVMRLITAIERGKKITNLESWIRSTGYNFIRELSRKRKYQNLDPNTLDSLVASPEDISLYLTQQEESERVHNALKELKPETQELIKLRFFQGLSWPEIVQHLTQNGQKVSEATLRKRGERAINQLKEVYFEKLPR